MSLSLLAGPLHLFATGLPWTQGCCVSLFNHDVSFAFALACDQLELQPRQHLVLLFSGTPTGKRSTECVRVRLRVCFIFEIRKE